MPCVQLMMSLQSIYSISRSLSAYDPRWMKRRDSEDAGRLIDRGKAIATQLEAWVAMASAVPQRLLGLRGICRQDPSVVVRTGR